ncbi:MAG: hypothetical protein P4L22_04245 [Candidatus Babeliales bacterium]|nr:hypothetical protein [Candidatus Babeliales bacterium]
MIKIYILTIAIVNSCYSAEPSKINLDNIANAIEKLSDDEKIDALSFVYAVIEWIDSKNILDAEENKIKLEYENIFSDITDREELVLLHSPKGNKELVSLQSPKGSDRKNAFLEIITEKLAASRNLIVSKIKSYRLELRIISYKLLNELYKEKSRLLFRKYLAFLISKITKSIVDKSKIPIELQLR